jgi:NADH:ubiquinone oxidoreductase subunit 5 (subunit L)/multisubunit Na+/H+ antiporter MnhA subunit
MTTYHPCSAERQEIRGLNQTRNPVGDLGLSVGVTFTFIIFLIISPNVICILLGWDGLGLVSYLSVIYYQNVKSYGAGMLIVLCNRIGDVALLMVIVWIINFGEKFSFS